MMKKLAKVPDSWLFSNKRYRWYVTQWIILIMAFKVITCKKILIVTVKPEVNQSQSSVLKDRNLECDLLTITIKNLTQL